MGETIRTCQPIESPHERMRRQAHRARTGHELVAIMVSVDGILWHRVTECCGETVEQRVGEGLTTWAQIAPTPDVASQEQP